MKGNADSKLKNVQAIKQMLAGTHKFQTKTTVGFMPTGSIVTKKVGDRWTDAEGIEWEQKDGYKIRVSRFDELRSELNSFKNCRKETCTCVDPGRADMKMKVIHGMCLDCVIDMEHELRLEGKFEEYASNKLKHNALSWLRDAEQETNELAIAVQKAPEFVHVDGRVDKWNLDYDPIKMSESILDQFNTIKQQVFDRYNITESEFKNFKESCLV
jgi:hypothetical protein